MAMIKRVISFTEPQDVYLQRHARKLGISQADLVRRIVDEHRRKFDDGRGLGVVLTKDSLVNRPGISGGSSMSDNAAVYAADLDGIPPHDACFGEGIDREQAK